MPPASGYDPAPDGLDGVVLLAEREIASNHVGALLAG
jgi:hypothetical protein